MYRVNVPAKSEGVLKTLSSPKIHLSRSSKVVDFGTNRKRV